MITKHQYFKSLEEAELLIKKGCVETWQEKRYELLMEFIFEYESKHNEIEVYCGEETKEEKREERKQAVV